MYEVKDDYAVRRAVKVISKTSVRSKKNKTKVSYSTCVGAEQ